MGTITKQSPVEAGFARRSARYLAERGCTPSQIRTALVDELDLAVRQADRIVGEMRA